MYDEFAEDRLRQLPELADTNWEECRRRLSRLYFASIQLRLNGPNSDISHDAIVKASDYLRRLANTLEQYLFSITGQNFDPDLIRARSYAFIAAEAIDLWCNFTKVVHGDDFESVDVAYARIESALLYLASDYQVNAHCSVAKIKSQLFLNIYDHANRDKDVILYLQGVICAFSSGNLRNIPNVPAIDYQQYDVIGAARTASMVRIGTLITDYCEWLRGQRETNDVEAGLKLLMSQLTPSSIYLSGGQFADLLHLCTLLLHVVRDSGALSVMHHLPRPEMEESARINYERYLSGRASRRPFLWPSAKEYVEKAFPGPHSDAVVVVPTGSGKSYLAELACSQAMQNGWVLYLAPTNALVSQVQRDLTAAFRTFEEAQILSFVGGQEYTSLSGELLVSQPNMSVAVMTPEKCAMAFRINPNVIQNCKLCIVDEFHTIDDDNRGITLDLCLAQILTRNSDTRLLLMSAMVSNGAAVTAWLKQLRIGQEVPLIQVPWRPCRTLRSLLFVNRIATEDALNSARSHLGTLPPTRKYSKFKAPLALLGGMRLRWDEEGRVEDYVSMPLPLKFEAKAKRGSSSLMAGGADWAGWKNTAGQQLAEDLSRKGLSALCFILSSRHHVFSSAESCGLDRIATLDEHTKALLALSDVELGAPSRVGELLRNGVGVHSSAMLDVEKAAVERCFGNKAINLLFATPTLAQGLNLPADVVVVAGSSLGGAQEKENDKLQGVRSPDATILNAFGRAGRAMVANHGLAVLVSDEPFFGSVQESVNVKKVVQRYRLLSGTDRCVDITSPITAFIDHLAPDVLLDAFSREELELVAQLGEEGGQNAAVLGHTFGAYIAQLRATGLSTEAAAGRIATIGENLIQEHNMPEWLPRAAMKGGIDLLTCWRLWRGLNDAIELLRELETADLQTCLRVFTDVMRRMPPKDIRMILPLTVRKMNTVLDRMLSRIGDNEYAAEWVAQADWVELWNELSNLIWMYMDGQTYAEIAAKFLSKEPSEIHSRRSQGQAPIPATFAFVGNVLHNLSIYAGAVLVILEESNLLNGNTGQMALLPLCIRNGCSSRDSFAWFRYGYRNRIAAHEFARTYPIPDEIQDESEIKQWVTEKRRLWLSIDTTVTEPAILNSVRIIINS